jgi:hypothetical protein
MGLRKLYGQAKSVQTVARRGPKPSPYACSTRATIAQAGIYSGEIQLQVAAVTPPTAKGFVKIAFINAATLATSSLAATQAVGCPPPTECAGPLGVKLGDALHVLVIAYNCDGGAFFYGQSGMEGHQVLLHTGGCGTSLASGVTEIIVGSGTMGQYTGFDPWGPLSAGILTTGCIISFPVTQSLIDYINKQTAAGNKASIYAEVK